MLTNFYSFLATEIPVSNSLYSNKRQTNMCTSTYQKSLKYVTANWPWGGCVHHQQFPALMNHQIPVHRDCRLELGRGPNQQTLVDGTAEQIWEKRFQTIRGLWTEWRAMESVSRWNHLPAQSDPLSPGLKSKLHQELHPKKTEFILRGLNQWSWEMARKTVNSKKGLWGHHTCISHWPWNC